MRKQEVAVVIPVYQKNLSELERISLAQGRKVLGHYDTFLVMPRSLERPEGTDGMGEARFGDRWFASTRTYSSLLMEREFYRVFRGYRYILIYQLDAFVFEDRLMHFCGLGYDYIGAPWLSGAVRFKGGEPCVRYVGNGGLSLRNVSGCMGLIDRTPPALREDVIEDLFFSMGDSEGFRVAPVQVALEFSFEMEVRRCFAENGGRLPFGCHAWERHDLGFWRPHIEGCGYRIAGDYPGERDEEYRQDFERQRRESGFWEKSYSKETLERFVRGLGREVCLWGAGERGRFLAGALDRCGISIRGYLDSDKSLTGKRIGRHEVLPVEAYREDISGAYVIIAMDAHGDEVAVKLQEWGGERGRDYIFYRDIFAEAREEAG